MYRHIAIPLKGRTTKCVLCCRLCFNPDGLVYIRNDLHVQSKKSKALVHEIDQKDLGRRGHSATHKCLVCAVHLCHVKGRFPGCSLTCFELWHTVKIFSKDERTQTLCHVKCPAAGRTDVVSKIDATGNVHLCGGKRGKAASAIFATRSRKKRAAN